MRKKKKIIKSPAFSYIFPAGTPCNFLRAKRRNEKNKYSVGTVLVNFKGFLLFNIASKNIREFIRLFLFYQNIIHVQFLRHTRVKMRYK